MKYRYVLKNIHTGSIHFKWYTIKQVEHSGLKGLFDVENYEILCRDNFSGWHDKNGKEIYDSDKFTNGILKGHISFIRGSFNCFLSNEEIMPLSWVIEDIEITGNIH